MMRLHARAHGLECGARFGRGWMQGGFTVIGSLERPATHQRTSIPAHHKMSVRTRPSNAVAWLSALILVLALVAAGAGLFWPGGEGPSSYTTVRGQTVELYGRGLYRYDTLFGGAGNRGTDAVVLTLGFPLLAVCTVLYRRGSLRGTLLLTGALTYFLYVYASAALGTVAYNELFLVYVALFSASLFALALAFRSIDLRALPAHCSPRLPRRGPAGFLFASALVTAAIWLLDPVTGLRMGEPPEILKTSTTLFTHALDLAIIVPAVALAGLLILRRAPLGYAMAVPLLVLEAMLAPVIIAQTVSQVSAGVAFTPAEIAGPIAGFLVLAVAAIWVIVALLRHISEAAPAQAAQLAGQGGHTGYFDRTLPQLDATPAWRGGDR